MSVKKFEVSIKEYSQKRSKFKNEKKGSSERNISDDEFGNAKKIKATMARDTMGLNE